MRNANRKLLESSRQVQIEELGINSLEREGMLDQTWDVDGYSLSRDYAIFTS